MISLIKRLSTGKRRRRKLLGRYRRILYSNKKYIRTVNIVGWILFLLTTGLYLFTMYPTVAFWDCGEFLASSRTLQVGHQPGAPLYQLLGSIISLLSFGNVKVATMLINSLSAIAGGISIMLLFHIFLYLFNKYSEMYVGNIAAAFMASAIFALTDSFWTCAAEAEVYTMSFLFTTLCIRIILHWEEKPNEKWIILLCLVFGLSYGVHPLTLLIVPAIVFIIWFHYKKISFVNILLASITSLAVIFLMVNAFPFILSLLEINIVLFISFLVVLAGIFVLSFKKKIAWLNSLAFCIVFFLVGCSTYIVMGIRGSENLPMNESRITNAKTLNEYISREAFSKAPIIYGPYYTDWPPKDFELNGKKLDPVFDKELMTFFPRMWNYTNESYANNYVAWVGEPKRTVNINGEDIPKPSFLQNVSYFLEYQLGYMYCRYLLWNFVGKTTDIQGDGSLTNGQAKTGLAPLDKLYSIDEGETILSEKNKGNNKYFAIPLILCLLGIFYHLAKDPKRFLFVAAIFIMYSIALVVYLNSAAYEIRERDYVYLPSFMAISIWIGIGMLGISQIIANLIRVKKPRYVLPIFLIVPIWIGIENFDDHNHRHQYTAYNFAYSMLNSCEKDALLIVDGDNDTYPLWYCQNVEHFRQDVRVVNRELLNNANAISLLQKAMPGSKAFNLLMGRNQYKDGVMMAVSITPSFDVLEMKEALKNLYNSKGDDEKFKNYFKNLHTNKFLIKRGDGNINISLDVLSLNKSDVVILDLIASNPDRPIYFSSYSNGDFIGLDDYLSLEGFAYKLNGKKVSTKDDIIAQTAGTIDSKKMYDNIMHNFSFRNFNKNTYFNELERSIVSLYVQNIRALAYKLISEKEEDKAVSLVNKCLKDIPYTIHDYPMELADFAIIYSIAGQENKAKSLMSRSLSDFEDYMERYFHGTVRFQSEQRLEAAYKVSYFMDLCILAGDWAEEDMRVNIAECFFTMIRPYLEITYRQKKMMQINNEEFYLQEIENIDNMLEQIREFANVYEETLPEEQ